MMLLDVLLGSVVKNIPPIGDSEVGFATLPGQVVISVSPIVTPFAPIVTPFAPICGAISDLAPHIAPVVTTTRANVTPFVVVCGAIFKIAPQIVGIAVRIALVVTNIALVCGANSRLAPQTARIVVTMRAKGVTFGLFFSQNLKRKRKPADKVFLLSPPESMIRLIESIFSLAVSWRLRSLRGPGQRRETIRYADRLAGRNR